MEFVIILRLYSPLIFFVIFIFSLLKSKHNDGKLSINFFGFIPISILLKKPRLIKFSIFVGLVTLLFGYYILLDYSNFFDEKYKLSVHVNDKKGIEELISELDIKEINNLPIRFLDSARQKYVQYGDSIIKIIYGHENFFSKGMVKNKSALDVIGESNIVMKKGKGIQTYDLIRSEGFLKWTQRTPSDKTRSIRTKFVNSPSKFHTFKFLESPAWIFQKKIIFPMEFKQYIVTPSSEEYEFSHSLYAVTIIRPFPFPDFSNSLYLFEYNNTLVPLGYGVYSKI